MDRRIALTLVIFTTWMQAGGDLFAQTGLDSSTVDQALVHAVSLYNKSIRDQALLFNGVEYKAFPEPYDGHPFFESEYVEEGSIRYEKELYTNVPMQYDLFKDELIIEHYDQRGYVGMVRLHQIRVSSFNLLDHNFVRIRGDSTGGVLRDGFYDLLYDGGIKLLVKRRKTIAKETSNQSIITLFLERNHYFLAKNGKYFQIKSKGSVLKVLRDKKKKLKQFAKTNRLDFKRRRDEAMSKIAAYYDQTPD